MIKIGVISDTHIPKFALDLPEDVYNDFVNVDLILHAGDLVELPVIKNLARLAPVKAVYGNMDPSEVREKLRDKEVIKIGKVKIGLIHGYGPPKEITKRIRSNFDTTVNAIVFGHTHMPFNEKIGKTLFFNPGSPTDKVFAQFNSYGILEVRDTEIEGRIIRI